VLRAGVREHNAILDQQLRFRLGVSYWFSDGAGGWRTRPEKGFGLELNEDLVELALSTTISTLPADGALTLSRRRIERSSGSSEPSSLSIRSSRCCSCSSPSRRF
jgi:hypothetical protein